MNRASLPIHQYTIAVRIQMLNEHFQVKDVSAIKENLACYMTGGNGYELECSMKSCH